MNDTNWLLLLIPFGALLAMILVYKISLIFWPDERLDPWDE